MIKKLYTWRKIWPDGSLSIIEYGPKIVRADLFDDDYSSEEEAIKALDDLGKQYSGLGLKFFKRNDFALLTIYKYVEDED